MGEFYYDGLQQLGIQDEGFLAPHTITHPQYEHQYINLNRGFRHKLIDPGHNKEKDYVRIITKRESHEPYL